MPRRKYYNNLQQEANIDFFSFTPDTIIVDLFRFQFSEQNKLTL